MSAPAETTVLAETGEPPAPGLVAASHEAAYHRPYLAHASMGPSTATALARASTTATALAGASDTDGASASSGATSNRDRGGDQDGPRLHVWSHTQGVYQLRAELARALRLAPADITVTHVAGAGCYGHNSADDAALDAALLAMAVPGRPVQVVWSRADELGWAPFGAAAVVRLAAETDPAGNVLSWRHEIWGNGHSTRPGSNPAGPAALLAAEHRAGGAAIEPAAEPPMARGGGAGRNAVPPYAFPAHQVINHRLLEMPLRTSALRSLGAFVNVFAAESFLDELAAAAGRDPVEYRLSCLADPRARAVVEAAARRSGWDRWAPSKLGRPADSAGHGIGFARYKNTAAFCAVVAEVTAVTEVRVRRLTVAVDAGLIINPDGAANQVEGGAIQAVSWTLKEQVRFDRYGVTSDTWETYPILRVARRRGRAAAG